MRVVNSLCDGHQIDFLMLEEDNNQHHEPDDFTTFLQTQVMVPLTHGVARATPEFAAVAARGAAAAAAAPAPGFPMIPTEVIYMRPDGVIEQIPFEHIEETDRRLVFAHSVEQVPRAYADDLVQMIDRLLLMVQRRQTARPLMGLSLSQHQLHLQDLLQLGDGDGAQ